MPAVLQSDFGGDGGEGVAQRGPAAVGRVVLRDRHGGSLKPGERPGDGDPPVGAIAPGERLRSGLVRWVFGVAVWTRRAPWHGYVPPLVPRALPRPRCLFV